MNTLKKILLISKFFSFLIFIINVIILITLGINGIVNDKSAICFIAILAYLLFTNILVRSDFILRRDIHVVEDYLKRILAGIFLILNSELVFLIYGIINFEKNNILWLIFIGIGIISNYQTLFYLKNNCNVINENMIYSCLFVGFLLNIFLFITGEITFFSIMAGIQMGGIIFISISKAKYIHTFFGLIPHDMDSDYQEYKNKVVNYSKAALYMPYSILCLAVKKFNKLQVFYKLMILIIALNLLQVTFFKRAYLMFYKKMLFADSIYNTIYMEASSVMCFSLFIWLIGIMICGYNYFTAQNKEIYMILMIIMSLSIIIQIAAAPKMLALAFLFFIGSLVMIQIMNKPVRKQA